jgi:hypothetical protein
MLAAGKRRPCCYSIVPLNLHKALVAAPKAKAQWHDLTQLALGSIWEPALGSALRVGGPARELLFCRGTNRETLPQRRRLKGPRVQQRDA